jgi:hypothetical protein
MLWLYVHHQQIYANTFSKLVEIRSKNRTRLNWKKNPTAPIITVAANGQLTAKVVYFLPWKPDVDVTKCCESIKNFVSDAMNKAASENYRSITFPAIGCGEYLCSINLVAQTIVNKAYHQLFKYPMSVSFVIQPDRSDIYYEFQKQLKLIQQSPEIKPVLVTIGKGKIEVHMGDITAQNVSAKNWIFSNIKHICFSDRLMLSLEPPHRLY